MKFDVEDDNCNDALYCSTRHSSWPIGRFVWWGGQNGFIAWSRSI